jgi:hypothetical protein
VKAALRLLIGPSKAEGDVMRLFASLGVFSLVACGVEQSHPPILQQGLCSPAETEVYKNRFANYGGGSGVATYQDAASGKVNSDGEAGPVTEAIDAGEGPPTAMAVSCAPAACAPGEVLVEQPPKIDNTTGGVGVGAGVDDSFGGPDSNPPPAPTPTTVCTVPPPQCPTGQSPQFTLHQTWECTDCSLVVTYGGIFGSVRRCVNKPNVTCTGEDVPTWSFGDEAWQCKTKCDNGLYDQHTIQGTLVCVPC